MSQIKSTPLSTGLAMFSMFFGAGNITFPLIIGQNVEGGIVLALLGLILTAVVIPFTGLMSITLFEGNYTSFFNRIGKIPALIVILVLLSIIGPFGGIPRLVTLTFSTLKVYFTGMHLLTFSLISCCLIFLFSWKKSRTLDLIGYVLSPLLVLSLLFIIVKGLFFSTPETIEGTHIAHPFLYGLREGYNTMDLIAAFFFSSLVYGRLQQQAGKKGGASALLASVFKASLIGASLLSLVYIGFGYVAANFSHALSGTPIDQLVGKLGHIVLGHHAGLIVCMSIVLTCLTTAIALTVVCADFLQQQVFKEKIKYEYSLVMILGLTALTSSLEFTGIVKMLSPVLQVIYPSLLVLCLFNILHKVFAVKPIKVPVFTAMTLVLYFQHVA